MSNMDRTMLDNNPTEFLEQLGDALGRPVGLGDEVIGMNNGLSYHTTVTDGFTDYGMFSVYHYENSDDVRRIAYEGEHPLDHRDGVSQQLTLLYARDGCVQSEMPAHYHSHGESFHRTDHWDAIAFP